MRAMLALRATLTFISATFVCRDAHATEREDRDRNRPGYRRKGRQAEELVR